MSDGQGEIVPGGEQGGAADAGTLLGGGGADPGGGGDRHDGADGAGAGRGDSPAAPAAWREDWRESIVSKLPEGEREKELSRLKRFASPENVYTSLRNAEKRISSGQMKATLPENPTPEEMTAYRKANGIPEKAEDYGLKFPDSVKASEADNADLGEFAAKMHEQNAPPGVTKAAFETFLAMREKAEQSRHENARKIVQDARVEMRTEWGRDYGRNVNLANEFLAQHAGGPGSELAGIQLADGTMLGDNPRFVKLLVNAALATAGDDHLAVADLASNAGGGASLEDRYAELLRQSAAPKGSDEWNKYHRQGGDAEAMKLRTALDAKQARGR